MKENYYRIERKKRQDKNTRLWLLGGVAAVVCVGVLSAAAVMYGTIGQSHNSSTLVGKVSSTLSDLEVSSGEPASSEAPVSSAPPVSSAAVSSSNPAASSQAASSVPATSSSAVSSATLVDDKNTMASGFDFSLPVGGSAAVDLSFFDDAAVIGDSRAVGLMNYTQLKNHATNYAKVSCVTNTVLNGSDSTAPVIESLEKRPGEFKKVYIMLGLNEIGYENYGVPMERYKTIIDRVRACQPDADIYLQTVLPITKYVEQHHGYLRKAKIADYNARLQAVATEKQVYLIDPSPVFAGEDGFMVEAAAASRNNNDGEIHFNKTYCQKWLEYLTTHTVK